MTKTTRQFVGIGLVVVGILLFVLQYRGGASQSVVLAVLGGIFFLGYFARKQYGLLVPACILLGLSLGDVIDRSSASLHNAKSLGLGIGFIAIYGIDRIFRREKTWWPLIPGAILIVSGLAQAMDRMARTFAVGWPVLVVVAGVLVWFGIVGRAKEGEEE